MKKHPTTAQRLEFEKLRAFVAVGFEDIVRSSAVPATHHPAAIADRLWAAAPSTALTGLRQAAYDVVEMFQDLAGDDLDAMEERFAKAGAPSLCELRRHRIGDIFRVLSRAKIRDDDEWRLINAVVSDLATGILDEAHRALAQRLVHEYEASRKPD